MAFRQIGTFVKQISEKNRNGDFIDVLGVSIEKEFMPSVANTIGTDLRKYNVLRKNRFAFNPMHVGRDKKLPIAVYHEDEPALVSPAYTMFEVVDENVEIKYLMLLFKTTIFDHLCWFYTDGSVRGGLTWNDFCNIELDIPTIDEQREILKKYNIIKMNIENLINEKGLTNDEAIDFIQKYAYTGGLAKAMLENNERFENAVNEYFNLEIKL